MTNEPDEILPEDKPTKKLEQPVEDVVQQDTANVAGKMGKMLNDKETVQLPAQATAISKEEGNIQLGEQLRKLGLLFLPEFSNYQDMGTSIDVGQNEALRKTIEQCVQRYGIDEQFMIRTIANRPHSPKQLCIPIAHGEIGNSIILLTNQIGEGAFGKVYTAVDMENPTKQVAIKECVLPTLGARSGIIQSVEQEIQGLGAADELMGHTSLYGDPHAEALYMAMPYHEGPTIEELLRISGGKLPMRLAVEIVSQTATKLLRIQEKTRLKHLDIKPSNIMITINTEEEVPKAEVHILDWGASKAIGEGSSSIHLTTAYAEPEQIAAFVNKDSTASFHPNEKTDVYALAATLFELISGQDIVQASTLSDDQIFQEKDFIPTIAKKKTTHNPDVKGEKDILGDIQSPKAGGLYNYEKRRGNGLHPIAGHNALSGQKLYETETHYNPTQLELATEPPSGNWNDFCHKIRRLIAEGLERRLDRRMDLKGYTKLLNQTARDMWRETVTTPENKPTWTERIFTQGKHIFDTIAVWWEWRNSSDKKRLANTVGEIIDTVCNSNTKEALITEHVTITPPLQHEPYDPKKETCHEYNARMAKNLIQHFQFSELLKEVA